MYPIISIGSIELESYTIWYLLVFIIVTFLLKHEFSKRHYSTKLFLGLLITGLLSGMIGSKIYFILGNWDAFTIDPFQTFFTISGSGWYGGFILGVIGILIFLKITKQPILKFLDILAPFILIGQAFGRVGCFLAGCCYGIPSDLPWAVAFPYTIYLPHVKVHPTQLYEMSIYLLIFVLLLRLRLENLKSGVIFGLYLALVGVGRFMVEFYRPNPKLIAQLSTPQIIALVGILFGLYFVFKAKQPDNAFSGISEQRHKTLRN